MNNFIITAMPRSGTKFLAHTMNLSKKFTVLHDHEQPIMTKLRSTDESVYMEYVNNRLNKNFYGEISGLYRSNYNVLETGKTNFHEFISNKKGVILRNPIKNIISLYNMTGDGGNYLKNIQMQMNLLDMISSMEGVKVIHFQKMTTDKDYLKDILEYFGITDVEITDNMIKNKINKRGGKHTISNFDKKKMEYLKESCSWFIEKYNLEKI